MKNGWTGGQYSLYRAVLGLYLCVHFAHLLPFAAELFSNTGALADAADSPLTAYVPNLLTLLDTPAIVVTLFVAAIVLSLLFAVGWHDRWAAVLLWYLWACLVGRNPLIGNPGIPYVGWLLLAHVFLPRAPFGSWSARGRADPGGGWRLPEPIYAVAWILMAAGYSYSGYTKLISPSWIDGTALARVLENPLARPGFLREIVLELPAPLLKLASWGALGLELVFLPLALFRFARPVIWLAMVAMHLSLIVVIDFADLTVGMLMLHLFTFDPAWIRSSEGRDRETLFYDGSCGLCHRAVRFLLAEESSENGRRFAPLGGPTYRDLVNEGDREELPDSLVVRRADGTLLVRAEGVLYLLRGLGGSWRLLAGVGGLLPASSLDRLYDVVARLRHRLFPRPVESCPIVPLALRSRFDD